MSDPVLDVRGLQSEFRIAGQWYPAVRDFTLAVAANETVALVGESGSGKSVTALSILNLLPAVGARIAKGSVRFDGQELVGLSEKALERLRGDAIAMIFQEPMTSLNPTMTVGDQIAEVIRIHRGATRQSALSEALRLLEEVRIPAARQRLRDYPHQFSGGMRQRVMIAMALACRPKLLLSDEPTTALDVTIQAQVLALLNELKESYGMSVLFITHNLGVVAQTADRVAVMYAGEIVECAPVDEIFAKPAHPYTEALLRAMPRVDRNTEALEPISGQVPAITGMPAGCAFAPRCPLREPQCEHHPELLPLRASAAHQLRCRVRAQQESAA